MFAEIVTIGDEILIGQTVDTNSAWMAAQLNEIGIKVERITSIADRETAILKTLEEVGHRSKLVLMTGGLGPTLDDITKRTLCRFFDTELVLNERVLARIESAFKARNIPILEVNRRQAELPASCMIIENELGTASGMWFEKGGCTYIAMPGVPYEMKHLMSEKVLPMLLEKVDHDYVVHRTVMTHGIGESMLSDRIKQWQDELEKEQIQLSYLPSPGVVKMRLSSYGGNGLSKTIMEKKLDQSVKELQKLIPKHIFSTKDEKMQKAVGDLLKVKGQTLSTAESCTGGYIAHMLTQNPGSSMFFKGSVIAYSNEVKEKVLNVERESLAAHGAVSEVVVEQMAKGALTVFQTDFAIATSGIAGPDGGSDEKPVGTVWLAVASKNGVLVKKIDAGRKRDLVIKRASLAALGMLFREIDQ